MKNEIKLSLHLIGSQKTKMDNLLNALQEHPVGDFLCGAFRAECDIREQFLTNLLDNSARIWNNGYGIMKQKVPQIA